MNGGGQRKQMGNTCRHTDVLIIVLNLYIETDLAVTIFLEHNCFFQPVGVQSLETSLNPRGGSCSKSRDLNLAEAEGLKPPRRQLLLEGLRDSHGVSRALSWVGSGLSPSNSRALGQLGDVQEGIRPLGEQVGRQRSPRWAREGRALEGRAAGPLRAP